MCFNGIVISTCYSCCIGGGGGGDGVKLLGEPTGYIRICGVNRRKNNFNKK